MHGTTKVQFSSCAKVFRNFSDTMRGSHILPSHTDAILTVTARSQKRPINVQGISGKPQEVRQGNGEKKLCSPDDNKNAGSMTGQKHRNDRALCRVKYVENMHTVQPRRMHPRSGYDFHWPICLS